MTEAMQAAGIAPVRLAACRIHKLPMPCAKCEDVFTRAERQKQWHDQDEGKRLHAEWLASRKGKA
jgi:hypothetical protein